MSEPNHLSRDESRAERGTPIISRVLGDTIVELVYDAERRETALAVSRFDGLWNIERELVIGADIYIPYSPNNNLIRTGCVLLPSKPEHHGSKVELLGEIQAYLHRYVDLSPAFARIAAHYVLLSWVYDAFNELPYLRLKGDFGTGKTRGLITIGSILYKPFFASGASTVSPIFHILDTFGGSLVLDESDFRFTDATNDLVKILNNGSMRGLPVLRTMQDRFKELNPRAFRVFGPKIIAMRESFEDRGLESRFVSENMNARRMRADIPFHLPVELAKDALSLRNRLLHFRFCNLFKARIDPTFALEGIAPRINQIALPLLSLVDDPAERTQISEVFMQQAGDSRTLTEIVAAKVLQILTRAFANRDVSAVAIGDITREVNTVWTDKQYSSKHIGVLIRLTLGIKTHKSNGVFVVTRDELPAIQARAARLGIHVEPIEPPSDAPPSAS